MKSKVTLLLLAGGKSERMGVPKGLLEYRETFWLLEQLNRITANGITSVYIGLGYDYPLYFNLIPWLAEAAKQSVTYNNLCVTVIINHKPELGSFSTLLTVLKSIPKSNSVLFQPIDIPLPNSLELSKILASTKTIAFPVFEGKNGHPILCSQSFCEHLKTLDPDNLENRLDSQIKKLDPNSMDRIPVLDCSTIKNLNTPQEWKEYTNKKAPLS